MKPESAILTGTEGQPSVLQVSRLELTYILHFARIECCEFYLVSVRVDFNWRVYFPAPNLRDLNERMSISLRALEQTVQRMFVKLVLKKAVGLIDLKLRRIVAACFGYAQEFVRVQVVVTSEVTENRGVVRSDHARRETENTLHSRTCPLNQN